VSELTKAAQYKITSGASLYKPYHHVGKLNDWLTKKEVVIPPPAGFGSRLKVWANARPASGDSPYNDKGEASFNFQVEMRTKRKSAWVPLAGVQLHIKWEEAPEGSKGFLMVGEVAASKPNLESALQRVRDWHQKTYGDRQAALANAAKTFQEHLASGAIAERVSARFKE